MGLFVAGTASAAPVSVPAAAATAQVESGSLVQKVHRRHSRRYVVVRTYRSYHRPYYRSYYRPHYRTHYRPRYYRPYYPAYYWSPRPRYYSYGHVRPYYSGFTISIGRGWGGRHYRW